MKLLLASLLFIFLLSSIHASYSCSGPVGVELNCSATRAALSLKQRSCLDFSCTSYLSPSPLGIFLKYGNNTSEVSIANGIVSFHYLSQKELESASLPGPLGNAVRLLCEQNSLSLGKAVMKYSDSEISFVSFKKIVPYGLGDGSCLGVDVFDEGIWKVGVIKQRNYCSKPALSIIDGKCREYERSYLLFLAFSLTRFELFKFLPYYFLAFLSFIIIAELVSGTNAFKNSFRKFSSYLLLWLASVLLLLFLNATAFDALFLLPLLILGVIAVRRALRYEEPETKIRAVLRKRGFLK